MRLIAKMRGIKVKKSISKIEFFKILKKKDKITYKESPFKSIITDIRSNLSKREHKFIKNGLKYAEEMKELKNLRVKIFKENLIKLKNDLIMKKKLIIELRKTLMVIMEKINLRVLKISDIYLMKKMSLHMKISDIYLMKMSLHFHLSQ